MIYTLNDYCQYASNNVTSIVVCPSKETETNLLSFHIQNGTTPLYISDCVIETAQRLPMPEQLMQDLDQKILTAQKRVIVVGIDSYLSLIGKEVKNDFMIALYNRIGSQKLNAVYIIGTDYFDATKFSNPKYENSLQVVHISGNVQSLAEPTVSVVPHKWIEPRNNPTTWHEVLELLCKFGPTGDYKLVLNDFSIKQSGLSDNVKQLLDISEISKRFYGADDDLPEKTHETLVLYCRDLKVSSHDYLESKFGKTNYALNLAVKRLLEMPDDEIWPAYVRLLQRKIDNESYLAQVLSGNPTRDDLLSKYVHTIALSLKRDKNTKKFADERAAAIKELGEYTTSYLIAAFVNDLMQNANDNIACWLNCGTEIEKIEILRRVSESDLTIGLPPAWGELYPTLADYLSNGFDYGDAELNAYFSEYRKYKITNKVTAEFVERAYNAMLPSALGSRDSILQKWCKDDGTALLIVDGMGAEYYPLILAMAKRKGINVESHMIAAVRLPTSTEFNPIDWDAGRLLPKINGIDNIVHNGAAMHESCPPSRNIVASLGVFTEIFNHVAKALTSFERVIVTADHGSSRLAVLAHNDGLNKTLPWNGEPQDWRYAISMSGMKRPPELESYYNAERNITYWVVRGYNRLPKKGPKLNELHGGATLEERLVPIIVFSRAKTNTMAKMIDEQAVEQLVEKEGFNI